MFFCLCFRNRITTYLGVGGLQSPTLICFSPCPSILYVFLLHLGKDANCNVNKYVAEMEIWPLKNLHQISFYKTAMRLIVLENIIRLIKTMCSCNNLDGRGIFAYIHYSLHWSRSSTGNPCRADGYFWIKK